MRSLKGCRLRRATGSEGGGFRAAAPDVFLGFGIVTRDQGVPFAFRGFPFLDAHTSVIPPSRLNNVLRSSDEEGCHASLLITGDAAAYFREKEALVGIIDRAFPEFGDGAIIGRGVR